MQHREEQADSTGVDRIGSVPEEVMRATGIEVSFGPVRALRGVGLTVHAGEAVALLGASGCGKTTFLRSIAGLEAIDRGEIRLSGNVVSADGRHVPPSRRGVGMVFQSYALWPHMTVERNVSFCLRSRSVTRRRARELALEMLEIVGLSCLVKRHPHELSGGQQQRVALARALVASRQLILFDEPLSNLDEHLRRDMRREVRRLQEELGFSSIWVTHDQQEAMSVADRIAIMRDGLVLSCGPPQELYEFPPTVSVARFLGNANVVPVSMVGADGARWRDGGWTFGVHRGDQPSPLAAVIRASDLTLAPAFPGNHHASRNGNTAHVIDVEYQGSADYVVIEQAGVRLTAVGRYRDLRVGDLVSVDVERAVVVHDDSADAPDQ